VVPGRVEIVGKYDAWDSYFENLEGDEAVLTFDQLEALIGDALPPSAYRHPAWWANVHYYAKWTDYGWYASPNLESRTVTFSHRPSRRGRPSKASAWKCEAKLARHTVTDPPPAGSSSAGPLSPTGRRLVLIGCVAQKRDHAAPAKDLYISTLWQKRRGYAESTGRPWGILSAEHGYLDPDTIIEPYDRYMGSQRRDYRVQWSKTTADQVIRRCRELGLDTVEVHAGAAYLENGLIEQLNRANIRVFWPLKGMRFGEQLSWYGKAAVQTGPLQASATVERSPSQAAQPPAPRLVSLHLIGAFDYRRPDAVEHFDYGWEGEAEFEGHRATIRHGVGHHVVYSTDRIHTVTWLDGSPIVEGVAADDYEQSRSLLSLIKHDGRSMVRDVPELPAGYESFIVVDHRSEIDASYSRQGLAVKIRVDDVAAWAHHALLRKSERQTVDARERTAPVSRPVNGRTGVPQDRIDQGHHPVSSETKAVVVRRMIEFGDSEMAGEDPQLTPNAEANTFLLSDPYAFLVAVICDYQIKAERAWEAPYLLAQRLGYFDPARILAEPQRLFQAFAQRPALHRYVRHVPEYILEATRIVVDEHGGDAGRIWGDHPTAAELQKRLRRFPGISQKKAAMAVEMLERDFKVPITDMQGSDVALDVHVRRVFLRVGLAERDDVQHIVDVARELYPQRPGALDLPAWIVGRTWCRPQNPNCVECVLSDVCPKLIERGDAVRGA